jgi:hemerythrin-like domain-containing protein
VRPDTPAAPGRSVEEQVFYPGSKQEKTEDLLREAVEEHLSVRKILADIMGTEQDDPQHDAKLNVLEEQVERHVDEEENELFPLASRNCSREELSEMGARMEQLAEELRAAGSPSSDIPGQTDEPTPL